MKVEIQKYNNLKTQADAVIHFLQVMDVEMVSDILDSNRTYQDFEKSLFIHKLGNALNKFLEAGDTFLNCHSGFCNSELCNYRCTGFSFSKLSLMSLLHSNVFGIAVVNCS